VASDGYGTAFLEDSSIVDSKDYKGTNCNYLGSNDVEKAGRCWDLGRILELENSVECTSDFQEY
jgi:hypothetical protein